jgi:hypothetical protein
LLLCLIIFTGVCAERDTVIVSDGGPGPYPLGGYFIDTATIRITFLGALATDSSLGVQRDLPYAPSYTFIDEANALLFSEPLEKGAKLRVRFTSVDFGMPRMYSLFEKRFAGLKDTLTLTHDSLFLKRTNEFAEDNITLSGYKSINVSVGSVGSMNLEQALDVSLAGDIAPQTTLSGHLTDQGTNIEGTRELSDFERIYVALENPRYNLVVGDQYVLWPVLGGILSGQKKLKGVSGKLMGGDAPEKKGFAGIAGSRWSVQGFGAICGGKFTVQTIKGKSGLQGPYYLSGSGEQGFIMPLRGTVSLTLNGKKCAEGDGAEFTVDYDLGSITFTPKTLVRDDDIMRVEYEYRLFDFQRTLVGANVSAFLPDSTVKVEGGVWYEADDKNRPIENAMSEDDKARMEQSGDSPPLHPSGREVLPVDVPSETQQRPLYVRDSLGHYIFRAYDPNKPGSNQGFFAVWFRESGAKTGAYTLDRDSTYAHPELHAKIYKYVGEGRGDATDSTAIPLPQAATHGEIRIGLAPLSWLSAGIDLAGMDLDKNVASKKDDKDNKGSATDARLTIGKKTIEERSFWLSGNHLYVTPAFTREVMKTWESDQAWDDTSANIRTGLRQAWQSSAGATIFPGASAEVSYGQFLHDNKLATDRIGGSAQALIFKKYSLEYHGDLFRHVWGDGKTRRDAVRGAFKLFSADCELTARDEWRTYPESGNRGGAGAGATVSSEFLSLRESLFYQLYRKGSGGLFGALDTGRSITWDQSFSRSLTKAWHVEATTRYLFLDLFRVRQLSTMLVTAQSDVSLPDNGISSHQEYRVNIEKASTYVQSPVYAQAGRGNYVWSDSLREYVPKEHGDYFMQQHEVYDSAGEGRVRKTRLVLNWSFAPVKKRALRRVLSDLSWYGSLMSEEHLSLDASQPAGSWIPGYVSLITNQGLSDSTLRLADLSYRQNVEWSPDSFKGYMARLFAEPFAKKIRDYHETGIEWGGAFERSVEPWLIGLDATLLSVWRNESSGATAYEITDRRVLATEKFNVVRPLALYVKETVGWASQTSPETAANQGWYYRIVPGVEWRIFDKGDLEVSYTYSFVGINGIQDPRIAQGFSSGVSHNIDASGHADFASHFSLDLSYHGEIGKNYYNATGLHVLSMQVKAYL